MNELKLNIIEENEINFQLKIEGTDLIVDKPKIRFTITEDLSENGWIFDSKITTNNDILIKIPKMKNIVIENKKYKGKLEIIFDNNYFTPTEVDIKFFQPIKIESILLPVNNQKLISEKLETKKIEAILNNNKKTSYNDLSYDQKKEISAIFKKNYDFITNNFLNEKINQDNVKKLMAETIKNYLINLEK